MELVIKINTEKSHEPCSLCDARTAETQAKGPMLFIDGTGEKVCCDCGYKHNPELTDVVAEHYQRRDQEIRAEQFNKEAAAERASLDANWKPVI